MQKWVNEEYNSFAISLSSNERFAAIYESWSLGMKDENVSSVRKIPVYLFNLAENRFSEISISIPLKEGRDNEALQDLKISEDGEMLYLNYSSMAEDLSNEHFIYEVSRQQLIKKLHEGDFQQSTAVTEPSAFAWGPEHQYYIVANKGGQLTLSGNTDNQYGSEMLPYLNDQGIGITTALGISKSYFFTCSGNGLITIWHNPLPDETAFGAFNFLGTITSFRLPTASPVNQVIYDSTLKKLYLISEAGEVYQVQLSQWVSLSRNADELKQQIWDMGLPGLTEAERKRLNVPLLTEK
jgi:hypothetical protein